MSELFPVSLFRRGYTDLVSVIPLNATLTPASKISANQLGKVPGRRLASGMWAGYNWRAHTPVEDDVRQWALDGANIGLRAKRFPGLDIDSLDETIALKVEQEAVRILGPAPVRVGRAPKRLLMYRTSVPFTRTRLWITDAEQKAHLIEFLGDGQQYIIAGIHPGTQQPYQWLSEIPGTLWLSEITPEKVDIFFRHVEQVFTALGYTVRREGTSQRVDRAATAQDNLLAPTIDLLRAAVAHIPNDDVVAPGRDEYIKMGYAIRAAGGGHEEEAYAIFAEWAGRHVADERVEGNPETWRSDWRRMQPPYSLGWDWIASVARNYGFNDAMGDFAPIDPPSAPTTVDREKYTDRWLAQQVAERLRSQLRFVPQTGKWLVWDGTRWHHDDLLRAQAAVGSALARIGHDVIDQAGPKGRAAAGRIVQRIESAGTLFQVMRLVQADPSIAVSPDHLDADPWLLNTPSGVVDLRSGHLVPPNVDHLMTKQTRVGPDVGGACPEWKRFLAEATGGNRELETYLQKLIGYALTGQTTEAIVAFVWGPGGNGKSVFLNAVREAMGDYAIVSSMDTFTSSNHDRHPTDLAALMGARLVTASETQGGRRWDEQRIKALTGNEPVTARFMRQDFFTYHPTFKLIFSGNHMPSLRDVDEGVRRRLHMVPFTVTPSRVDPDLGDKLVAEYPAILGWAIEGCLLWQREGLAQTPVVSELTTEYIETEDSIGAWMSERCDRSDPTAETSSTDLFDSWREWANMRGEYVGSHKRFALTMLSRGVSRHRYPSGVKYGGIKLNAPVFP